MNRIIIFLTISFFLFFSCNVDSGLDPYQEMVEETRANIAVDSRDGDLYFGGDMNAAPALTGQSAGLIDEVKPVAQIIEETISEFNETCQKMSAQKF